jgi:hypothetical protein
VEENAMRGWGHRKAANIWATGLAACALTAATVTSPAVAALAATGGANAVASLTWTVRNSPNASVAGGQLRSVSCSAAGACTAVGTYVGASGLAVTLGERWNGKSWHAQSTANPPDTVPVGLPDLLGVSCPAANFCEAVGAYQVTTVAVAMAEGWNGRGWTWQRFPVPTGSTSAGLNRVSCTSARFCEALGSYTNGIDETLPFAAGWNGTSWHLQRTPVPAGVTGVFSTGISCASPAFCEAGGNAFGDSFGPFVMRWNGAAWHLQTMPGNAGVGSVSCVSVTFCEIVGSGGGDVWDGTRWSAQTIPGPAGAGYSGVSCSSAAFCQAVGQYNDSSGSTLSVSATWNGTWTSETTQNPVGSAFTTLDGVSCVAAAACEAVGDYQPGTSNLIALAESRNGGSWRMQHGVAPLSAASNSLSAVSCVSLVFCVAVGSHPDSVGLAGVALAEAWNGTVWKIQAAVSPAVASNGLRMSLSGVSCVSALFCEAVGSSSLGAGGGAEVWNGTKWSLQAVPGGPLTSVSCAAARFCLAAGGDGHVDMWNGKSWSAQANTTGFTSLSSVACAAARSCEAVGTGPSGAGAERWNGASWSAQAIPAPAGGSSLVLSGVSCGAARSCLAVGSYTNSSFQSVTLAEAWNGFAWHVKNTPNPVGSQSASLAGVACTAANSCTAVGQNSEPFSNLTIAEVWNGKTWTLRSTPDFLSGQATFSGVSCGLSQACTAVGATSDAGGISATLIETGD